MIKKLTNHILSYLISSNAIDDNEEKIIIDMGLK